jgi:hypothetical protein
MAERERARRRRQRQRKAARRKLQRNVPKSLTNSQFRGGSKRISVQNVANEIACEEKGNGGGLLEEVKLQDTMSDDMVRFCEAVVHPFGGESVGAILPDRYQELVVPVTDRLELDLTPELFNHPLATLDWQDDSEVQLTGIFMWFQPRCLQSGTLTTFDDPLESVPILTLPYLGVNDDLSTASGVVALNQYNVCFTGIWSSSNVNDPGITYGFYNNNIGSGGKILSIYYAIQLSRFENIKSNCDKMRVLGAGLKMWSEQAPINTGGYSVGGWITIDDIMTAMQWTTGATSVTGLIGPLTPGALKNIQPSIRFACRSPGVQGSTVRYSCLQTAEQIESEYPTITNRDWVSIDGAQRLPIVGSEWVAERPNSDLSIHDVITAGSYVPCIFWQFNITDQESNNGIYTVKVMSMVHGEGSPTGSSPFMSNKVAPDPSTEHAKMMLENVEVFPVATKGHSFRSFMSKAKRVVASVVKGAGHITKMLSLVDRFGRMFV